MKLRRRFTLIALMAGGLVGPNVVVQALPASQSVHSYLVLDVRASGGYVFPDWQFSRLPQVSVYSNGTILTAQELETMQYPGSAAPTMLRRMVPRDVQRITEGAIKAQLGNTRFDWGVPKVADVPSTLITLRSARIEKPTKIEIASLGIDYGLSAKQVARRASASKFINAVRSFSQPYITSKGTAKPWVSGRWAYIARPDAGDEFSINRTWFGQPLIDDGQCVLMSKAENLQLLRYLPFLDSASRWNSGGQTWRVTLRPLLPHERSCSDINQ